MPEQSQKRGRGRPPKQEQIRNQRQFTVLLPPDLVASLDQEVKRAGLVSRSEIIRRACAQYLERLKEEK